MTLHVATVRTPDLVMQKGIRMPEKSASQQIDDIIKAAGGWQGALLSELRAAIKQADPELVEEVKWKKPSKPEGVAVWSHDGILCLADLLKNAVRLTFPKGAQLDDPKKLFNTRLTGNTVRGIDFAEGASIDKPALRDLIREAVRANTAKAN
jgi:hypothetical protein